MNLLPSEKKRETLVKSQDLTDERSGKKPAERPIEEYIQKGAINLDKPAGPTSHEVTSWVKKILNPVFKYGVYGDLKAGHSGTLDPNVTGLLPIMLGEAAKAVDALLTAGKEYVCLMKLHTEVPEKRIKNALSEFTGEIFQKPSIKSAVKRETRIRTIYYLELLEIEDRGVLFKVGCEAGTYVRKLCHDMGLALGTGAHMQELRRTKSGPFREDETLITLHDLQDAYIGWKENGDEGLLRKVISPMEFGLSHLPRIVIRDNAVDAVCHGAALAAPGVLSVETGIEKGDIVAVFTLKGEAVSFGKAQMKSSEILKAATGIVANTDRVLMEPGTYPKGWKAKA
ncbi:MAG: RNA-guided pseudouridylation complex pseudouridine synthase subunit Cbf5 [Euryarchaeota archaeon]|nr:RNA-guided pseudouridylation complex pseudouridine synthase subunit Cbf5 [Euryarchaeota archaeon]MCG2727069.1 RNA-guided pseudouridylation complex pseudouridine synthase subunit Cbf5 [Candidatus Methanoperedenaceae archaeon]